MASAPSPGSNSFEVAGENFEVCTTTCAVELLQAGRRSDEAVADRLAEDERCLSDRATIPSAIKDADTANSREMRRSYWRLLGRHVGETSHVLLLLRHSRTLR